MLHPFLMYEMLLLTNEWHVSISLMSLYSSINRMSRRATGYSNSMIQLIWFTVDSKFLLEMNNCYIRVIGLLLYVENKMHYFSLELI